MEEGNRNGKSVYISSSAIAGAEEGVFARRGFLPGDLVTYFNGVRVLETQIYRENMTEGGQVTLTIFIL